MHRFYSISLAMLVCFGLLGCGDKAKEESPTDGAANAGADVKDKGKGDQGKAASGGGAADGKPQIAANGLDVRYVTDDYLGAVVIHPRRILDSKLAKSLPEEAKSMIVDDFTKTSGISLQKVDRMVGLFGLTEEKFAPDAAAPRTHEPDVIETLEVEEFESKESSPAEDSLPEDAADPFGDESEPGAADGANAAFEGEAALVNFQEDGALDEHFGAPDDFEPSFEDFEQSGPRELATLLVFFSEAVEQEPIIAKAVHNPQPAVHNGVSYFKTEWGQCAGFLNDTTFLMCDNEAVLKKMLDRKGGSSDLAKKLAVADLDADVVALGVLDPIRGMIAEGIKRDPPPPPFGAFVGAVEMISGGSARLDLSSDTVLVLGIDGVDEEKAEQLKGMLNGIIQLGIGFAAQAGRGEDVPPEAQKMIGQGVELLRSAKLDRDGSQVTFSVPKPEGFEDMVVAAIGTAMIEAEQAAGKAQEMNDLRQILIAILNYESVYGRLPAASLFDEDGKPLLSWRVGLLPFIDGDIVRDKMKLEEAWDSEFNLKALEEMPSLLGDGPEGKTRLVVFTGEGTPLGGKKGVQFKDIKDGAFQTVAVIVVGPDKAQPWTKPGGIEFDPDNLKESLGDVGDAVLVGFFDGHVEYIPVDQLDRLKAMITHQGGEVIERDSRDRDGPGFEDGGPGFDPFGSDSGSSRGFDPGSGETDAAPGDDEPIGDEERTDPEQ
jgi:hypothetical protein